MKMENKVKEGQKALTLNEAKDQIAVNWNFKSWQDWEEKLNREPSNKWLEEAAELYAQSRVDAMQREKEQSTKSYNALDDEYRRVLNLNTSLTQKLEDKEAERIAFKDAADKFKSKLEDRDKALQELKQVMLNVNCIDISKALEIIKAAQ